MPQAAIALSSNRPTVMPQGFLHLAGEFARDHRPEIYAVMHEEACRARRQGATGRIVGWDKDGSGGVLVVTSTEHLAHRLGRALQKALGGRLHHGFNQGHKLALVWWSRQA